MVGQDRPNREEAQEVLNYLARRAKARFYADENFPAQAVSLLREMGRKYAQHRKSDYRVILTRIKLLLLGQRLSFSHITRTDADAKALSVWPKMEVGFKDD